MIGLDTKSLRPDKDRATDRKVSGPVKRRKEANAVGIDRTPLAAKPWKKG